MSVGRRLPAPRCHGKSPEEGGRKADRDRQREEKGAGRRAGRPAVGRRRAGGVPGGSRRHEGRRRGTRSSLVAAAAPRSPFRTALTRTREPRPDPPWRSSGASERLPGGPAQSRSPCRSGRRGAGRCSGKGEHLSADVAHAHPHARARAVFPPRPGGRARAFPHRPSSSTSPHPYPSRPLPAPPFFPSIDEAIRVASVRAPGGPAPLRSPSRGSRCGVRCSGTGGLLSGSLPVVREVRRSPARSESGRELARPSPAV